METLEDKGVIVLRAFRPKTQMPVKISPMRDPGGKGVYTGQGKYGIYELMTEEEKRALAYVITPETIVTLTDGKIFDLDNDPVAKANWKWVKLHDYIALEKEMGNDSARVKTHYVENPAAEAVKRVSATEDVDNARYQLRQASHEARITAAKALGLTSASSFSSDQLLDWLRETASVTPKAVLQALDTKNKAETNATIFFHDLVKYKLVEKGYGGMYELPGEKGGSGTALGLDQDSVVKWILDSGNSAVVKILMTRLTEIKGGK